MAPEVNYGKLGPKEKTSLIYEPNYDSCFDFMGHNLIFRGSLDIYGINLMMVPQS